MNMWNWPSCTEIGTPKSGGYINGMLDAIARYLIRTGKMMKSMNEPRSHKTVVREENTAAGENKE